jgi:hypothetical protein
VSNIYEIMVVSWQLADGQHPRLFCSLAELGLLEPSSATQPLLSGLFSEKGCHMLVILMNSIS